MTLDYSSPGLTRPQRPFPWRLVAILFGTVLLVFVLFCSGLSFPILGGASRNLERGLWDDFALTLPKSAAVEHGARVAYRDPSYFFVVKFAPADLQPFIDAIRAKGHNLEDRVHFTVVGPQPPSWFDVANVNDLITFDVRDRSSNVWRLGYSPSTSRIYVMWISF